MTQEQINKIKAGDTLIREWDKGKGAVTGLHLIVNPLPSGKKTWYLAYTVKNHRMQHKIADGSIPLKQAREIAIEWLSDAAKGINPRAERRSKSKEAEIPTLKEIYEKYKQWIKPAMAPSPRKSADTTLRTLRAMSSHFFKLPVNKISTASLNQFADDCRKKGNKALTVNRRIATLKAMWNWAIKNDYITPNFPFPKFDKIPETDSNVKVRYLTSEEREKLLNAIEEREKRQGADYLKPAVIISLNTGIRKSALLKLRWGDITEHADGSQTLHLSALSAKSGKNYDLPLNRTLSHTLEGWKENYIKKWGKAASTDYIIRTSVTPEAMPVTDLKKAWYALLKEAEIENFRWHDMRHDFASQLVMHGVNLYTVQQLMTHEMPAMTQRYAHLAPSTLSAAVESLIEAKEESNKK